MTKLVFQSWGINDSAQFGNIVYNLIDVGLLGRQDTDRREDFDASAFDIENDLEE